MKKSILILALLTSFLSFSQLSELSKVFKDDDGLFGDIYENIRSSALERWDVNHVMIVDQINQNTEACYDLFKQLPKMNDTEKRIFRSALDKWVEDDDKLKYESNVDSGDGQLMFKCCKYNWVMVQSEVKQQIKASKEY